VLKFYETATNADQRNSALRSLGAARDPALMQRTVDLMLSEKVRSQDIYMAMGSLRGHSAGIRALWQWLQASWDEVRVKFPGSLPMLGTIVQSSTASLTRQEQLDELLAFFEDKDKGGYDRSLAQSIDSIKAKIEWTKRDGADVKAWLGL